MPRLKEMVDYTLSEGTPIRHGDTTIIPVSRVLAIRLPFVGYVWNRPVSVRVESNGTATELAIVDVTLMAQLGLLAIGAAASIVAFVAGRARRE